MADIIYPEYVQIGTWVFGTPCCVLEDGSGVYSAPSVRGEDRTVPGVAGVAVRPRVLGAIRFSMPFVILGHADPDGVAFVDVRVGLATNIAAMQSALLAGSPTLNLVHGMDGDPFRTASCIVVAVDGPSWLGLTAARFSVDVVVPSGAFSVAP